MCQGAPPVELTVALDATLWDEPTTGIGRYGHAVAGALEARGVRVLRVGARRSGELARLPLAVPPLARPQPPGGRPRGLREPVDAGAAAPPPSGPGPGAGLDGA